MENELLQKNSSLNLKIDESLKTIQAEREFVYFICCRKTIISHWKRVISKLKIHILQFNDLKNIESRLQHIFLVF